MDPQHEPHAESAVLLSAAHARLRGALATRPGWRSLPPQHLPATNQWRASAYDARGGGTSARTSAVGETEEHAVSNLAELLLASPAP
jgi:hypothetical protein